MTALSRFFFTCVPPSNNLSTGKTVGQRKQIPARTGLVTCLLLLLVLSAALPSAVAQENTASITGTVLDSTGATIKGAKVTAKDVERGTSLVTNTNDSGTYDFPRVPVGNYEVSVAAQGFQTAVQKNVTLTLNQSARIDLKLKVGETTEVVEVTATAPILQTDTTLLGNLIDSNTALNLPLSTHNTNQLTLLASPGVVTPNLFGFMAAQTTFGTGRPYVNGAREQENNFVLDGMDNNQPDNNDVGFVPSPEAVQEFNLITGNAPADFGNYLGGVVNVTLKSGTNSFHGSGYEYIRRGGLNANSWSNNLNGIKRPGLKYDNFGATFGGPVLKQKLFFFMDYSESLFSQPASVNQLQTIPLAQRTGDFSALCQTGFTGGLCNDTDPITHLRINQLYDPASSANPATRTPFLNNQIPIGRFSSAARAIINSQFYPGAQLANNVSKFSTDSYQGDLKIDYLPSDKDHLMGRWSQQFVTAPNSNSILLLGDSDRTFPLKQFVIDETHTFSSSLLNDARAGFSYFPVTEGFSNPTNVNLPASFGIAGVTGTFLPAMVFTC